MLQPNLLAALDALPVLLASAPDAPTWTNRDVLDLGLKCLGVAIALVAAIAGGIWAILKHVHAKHERDLEHQLRSLEADVQSARQQLQGAKTALENLKEEKLPTKIEFEEVKKHLSDAKAHANELETTLAYTKDTAASRELAFHDLKASLARLEEDLSDYDRKLRATTNRVKHALKLEGLIWEEKVLSTAPSFRPLSERQVPIVSVLNLKGGVGKTTITANLGTAFAALGYRVLLVDLDLQGSLTSLFLPEGRQLELYHGRSLVQNFFDLAAEDVSTKLLDYCQPILDGKSGLVATADTLAYTELNLTFKWLLRIGKRDPRFLLRKASHLKQVTRLYDIVLLDCPPLMNVSCVNALAASDYLLVPVMPSKQAMGRVPPLLKMLRSFRENINHDLKVLGILANRTLRSELTTDEVNRWAALRDKCQDQWGEPVPMCATTIRQSTEIREVEDARRPLGERDEMYPVFMKLAEELERRVPASSVLPDRRSLVGGSAS